MSFLRIGDRFINLQLVARINLNVRARDPSKQTIRGEQPPIESAVFIDYPAVTMGGSMRDMFFGKEAEALRTFFNDQYDVDYTAEVEED